MDTRGVCLVTGAGRGIGLAIAERLARDGHRVALGDLDTGLAQAAASRLPGGPHVGLALDVRDRGSFDAFVTHAEAALGPARVLVNNAGIMPTGPFVDEDDAVTDAQIDVNLRGVIHGCKRVLPGMLARRGGHVVNVASMAGRLAIPGMAVYCATKFAVVGLTEALAAEHRDTGVRFTVVLPAKVTTELAAGTDDAGRGIPTASPEDVADAIAEALRTGQHEVHVPKLVALVHPAQALAPRRVVEAVRAAIDDRRILTRLDGAARAAYDARIRRVAAAPRR